MICKISFLVACLCFTSIIQAQLTVEPLIKAEAAFEDLSHRVGLKKSFIQFADSNAHMFLQKGTVNAHQYWGALPDSLPGFYNWAPAYAEISNGGDWGYTTGPSEFRQKSLEDTVAHWGQYTTIWHKDATGNWKYLLDIGTKHDALPLTRNCRQRYNEKSPVNNTDSTTILQLEGSFNTTIHKNTP